MRNGLSAPPWPQGAEGGVISMLEGKSVLVVADWTATPLPGQPTLGLGEIVRIITMVPQYRARRVTWCSPPTLFCLVRDCAEVDDIVEIGSIEKAVGRHDVVVNFTFRRIPGAASVVEIDDILPKEGTLKKRVFDMPNLTARRLGLASIGKMPVAKAKTDVSDVGLNWRVPLEWQIKALPRGHWEAFVAALPRTLSVSWQPHEDALEAYVEWIKGCRVLISVVGFGCHVAMYYGRKLIMLSGPTDFSEVHDYRGAKVLYPPSPCPYRPCYLPTGVANCGCMPEFRPSDLADAVIECLNESP